MLAIPLFKRPFFALFSLVGPLCSPLYADYAVSGSPPPFIPYSVNLANTPPENAIAFRDRYEDKTLYNRNYYRYDWNYRNNWRSNPDAYLRGGNQPPVYRKNGSYAPIGMDYEENAYRNNDNGFYSSDVYRGNIPYNIGTNDSGAQTSEIDQNNHPYDPHPGYYKINQGYGEYHPNYYYQPYYYQPYGG